MYVLTHHNSVNFVNSIKNISMLILLLDLHVYNDGVIYSLFYSFTDAYFDIEIST